MKIRCKWLAVAALALGLGGCASTSAPPSADPPSAVPDAAFPAGIRDATGSAVHIEREPKRIVSLIPSNTEIAFAIGKGDAVVGASDFDTYPAQAARLPKVGGMEFSAEKVIALKPDLVLAHESAASIEEGGWRQLREAGIPVFVVQDAQRLADVYRTIETIGRVAGAPEKADRLVARMKREVEAVRARAPKRGAVRALVEVSGAPEIYAAGAGTFIDELLQIAGARNAAGDVKGWAKLDPEAIVHRNPDVLLLTYADGDPHAIANARNRPGFRDVRAVRDGRVLALAEDPASRPGPRLTEALRQIARAVYPSAYEK